MNSEVPSPSREPSAIEPRNLLALICGVMGPPLIWLAQFEAKYALASGTNDSGRHRALVLTGFVAFALIGGLMFGSYREWRRAGASPLNAYAGVDRRTRFLAVLGMMSAGLFWLALIAQMSAEWFIAGGSS
jgi:hypothetical protein